MADARFQTAKRDLKRAEERLERQRALAADFKRHGSIMTKAAEELLAHFEDAVARHRERVEFLSVQYGLKERLFNLIATSAAGARYDELSLNAEAGVMKAMDLVDEGFDHIVLRDVATGEDLHFRPPPNEIN